jgi:hypothetical protein
VPEKVVLYWWSFEHGSNLSKWPRAEVASFLQSRLSRLHCRGFSERSCSEPSSYGDSGTI